jgi:hypothetical protein
VNLFHVVLMIYMFFFFFFCYNRDFIYGETLLVIYILKSILVQTIQTQSIDENHFFINVSKHNQFSVCLDWRWKGYKHTFF